MIFPRNHNLTHKYLTVFRLSGKHQCHRHTENRVLDRFKADENVKIPNIRKFPLN